MRSCGNRTAEMGDVMVFGLDSLGLFGATSVVAVMLTAAAFAAGRSARDRNGQHAGDTGEARRRTLVVLRWAGMMFAGAVAAWAILDGGDWVVGVVICATYVVAQTIALVIVRRRYGRN